VQSIINQSICAAHALTKGAPTLEEVRTLGLASLWLALFLLLNLKIAIILELSKHVVMEFDRVRLNINAGFFL